MITFAKYTILNDVDIIVGIIDKLQFEGEGKNVYSQFISAVEENYEFLKDTKVKPLKYIG